MNLGPVPDHEIERLSQQWPPLIAPFHREDLNAYGYDVRLSGKVWRLSRSWGKPLNPFDPPPDEAWEKYDLEPGHEILVQFGELWLAQTEQYFCLPADITSLMLNRSKYARCGATPNAGLAPGDAGWHGYYVLELLCHAGQGAIYTVGKPIAQIMFLRGAPCERPYNGGHTYQGQTEIRGPMG